MRLQPLGQHHMPPSEHLAQTRRKLTWNAAGNDVLADKEASAMLERAYRESWAKELRVLLT